MEGERATPNCRSKRRAVVARTRTEGNRVYSENAPEMWAEYGSNQEVFSHWDILTSQGNEGMWSYVCYIQNKLTWCDFNQVLHVFFFTSFTKEKHFYKTCKLKERKKICIHKIYYLNSSIQFIFLLKVVWRNRPKSAKHATNRDNMITIRG